MIFSFWKNSKNVIKDVIEYLNNKLGTRYKYTTKDIQSHIKARLKEGFTYEDFVCVIDKKYAEWHGTKMEEYLRPITLFSTKFQSYLNQKGATNEVNSGDAERKKLGRYC